MISLISPLVDTSSGTRQSDTGEEAANSTFTASLITHVVNNIQIVLKDVHIRYEDNHSIPGVCHLVGFLRDGTCICLRAEEGWGCWLAKQ